MIVRVKVVLNRTVVVDRSDLLRPEILPSRPNEIFPHDLVEHCISYSFGIVQLSVGLGGVNVSSSWSTSIWVTMFGLPKQHFRSSLFIVTTTMAS